MALGHEFFRGRSIELKHVEVARQDELGGDIVRQLRRLGSGKISRHPSFGGTAIDRENGDVHAERAQLFRHLRVSDGVATVVNRPFPKLEHVAKEPGTAVFVTLDRFMS